MHSEKAQSSSRIGINMARRERHQFVDLLACGIEARRMVIQVLVLMERQNTVAAIDLTTRGIHQFFNIVVPVPIQYMSNSDEIALDVSRMVLQGIANASLGREIHHHLRLFFGKKSPLTHVHIPVPDSEFARLPAGPQIRLDAPWPF